MRLTNIILYSDTSLQVTVCIEEVEVVRITGFTFMYDISQGTFDCLLFSIKKNTLDCKFPFVSCEGM